METIKKITIPLGILNVVVFLAFFFAKIFDKIDWSWIWVFSPLWVPFAIPILTLIALITIYLSTCSIDLFVSLWKNKLK